MISLGRTNKPPCNNGVTLGTESYLKYSIMPEDRRKLMWIKQIIDNVVKVA